MGTNIKASERSKTEAAQLHAPASVQPKQYLTNKNFCQLFRAATKKTFVKNAKKGKPHSIQQKTGHTSIFTQTFAHIKKAEASFNHAFRATVLS